MFHSPGEHELTTAQFETPFVLIAVRLLVDPNDPSDVAAVNALQDQFTLTAGSAQPFALPDYDQASFDATREALLELAKGVGNFDRAFGSADQVDPVRHLIATAAGWGGLPDAVACQRGRRHQDQGRRDGTQHDPLEERPPHALAPPGSHRRSFDGAPKRA